MKEAQVLHLLQLQSIELLHVGNKQTQLRDILSSCIRTPTSEKKLHNYTIFLFRFDHVTGLTTNIIMLLETLKNMRNILTYYNRIV